MRASHSQTTMKAVTVGCATVRQDDEAPITLRSPPSQPLSERDKDRSSQLVSEEQPYSLSFADVLVTWED